MKWQWISKIIFWKFQYSGENLSREGGATVVGALKSWKVSGIPFVGVKSGKEITRASAGLTIKE